MLSGSFCCTTREHFIKKKEQKKNKNIWLHLQVQTVILAGTLIVLLMTANTLMLYSMPAWSSKIVQVVMLPGILISSCTPDREAGEEIYTDTWMHCFFFFFYKEIGDVDAFKRFRSNGKLTHGCPALKGQRGSVLTSGGARCVGHQEICQHNWPLPLQLDGLICHPSNFQVHGGCNC